MEEHFDVARCRPRYHRHSPGTYDAAPRFGVMASRREPRHDALLAQQAALAEFGEFALRTDDLDAILNEASRLVGRALGTDLAKVMERQADGRTLLVRAGVGWEPGLVGRLTITTEEDTSTAHALATGEPAISPDVTREKRFKVATFLVNHGVKALVNVTIHGQDGKPPYGILEVDSREPRRFTKSDTDFLRTYANLLADAIERIRTLRELRSAITDKERLLRELQHRVKNNLQMVTSFVRLQERRARSHEARGELLAVGRRIETLSLVYEKLYTTGEVERVDLGTYLGELGASLLRLHAGEATGVRLRTEVESLVVPLDKAVPLGLIANEFVTNSFKHAFAGAPGVIGLELGRSDTGKKARLRLWDDGKGLPQDPKAGTGLALIEGFVRQIGGTAAWEVDGGTRLTIEFAP
jgi:two-component sensor histidine kinase